MDIEPQNPAPHDEHEDYGMDEQAGRPHKPATNRRVAHGLWNWVLPAMFFMSMVVLVVYAAPYLLVHWKLLWAHGEAEAAFEKRRAELRAEAEHADERLVELDKRVQLTSLGFREVVRKVTPHVVHLTCFKEISDAHPPVAKG